MDGRRRKTVHAARRPEERPKDASHSSTFTECTSAMLTLPSFAGPTSARSVTRTVRMRFSVGTGSREPLILAFGSSSVRNGVGRWVGKRRCPDQREVDRAGGDFVRWKAVRLFVTMLLTTSQSRSALNTPSAVSL